MIQHGHAVLGTLKQEKGEEAHMLRARRIRGELFDVVGRLFDHLASRFGQVVPMHQIVASAPVREDHLELSETTRHSLLQRWQTAMNGQRSRAITHRLVRN